MLLGGRPAECDLNWRPSPPKTKILNLEPAHLEKEKYQPTNHPFLGLPAANEFLGLYKNVFFLPYRTREMIQYDDNNVFFGGLEAIKG